MDEFFENSTIVPGNETGQHEPAQALRTVFNIAVIIAMLIMMFSMGCEVKFAEVLNHLRKPTGIIVGMCSQFIVMPLMGFSAIKIVSVQGYAATSIMILSCCPGGGFSNVMAYISRGDVPLSVTMTTISNVLAFGFLPLNIWVYSHGIETHAVKFPFKEMVLSMLGLTAVLAGGILTRWKKPEVASIITKVGVIGSASVSLVGAVLALILYSDYITSIPLYLFEVIFIVAPVGMLVSFCGASMFQLSWPARRTIAIESAVQNIGTAITICVLSFPADKLKDLSMYIILYGGTTTGSLLVAAGVFALVRYYRRSPDEEKIVKNDSFESSVTTQTNLTINSEN